MASRIFSLVIELYFGIFFHLGTLTTPKARCIHRFEDLRGFIEGGSENSRFAIEVGDLHDQRVVRIARTDDSRRSPRVFGRKDNDAHAAVAMRYYPLEVGDPLVAYPLRLPFQRRRRSRLVGKATVLAHKLVLPHRDHDGCSVAAYGRSRKVPTRASGTEMLETSRECPGVPHMSLPRDRRVHRRLQVTADIVDYCIQLK